MEPEQRARIYALRVKIKSLTAESRIIRHEEKRFPTRKQRKRAMHTALLGAGLSGPQIMEVRSGQRPMPNDLALPKWATRKRDNPIYTSLHHHRTVLVRGEARSALLAYAYLRGYDYQSVERSAKEAPNPGRVVDIVRRFGTPMPVDEVAKRVYDWFGQPRV